MSLINFSEWEIVLIWDNSELSGIPPGVKVGSQIKLMRQRKRILLYQLCVPFYNLLTSRNVSKNGREAALTISIMVLAFYLFIFFFQWECYHHHYPLPPAWKEAAQKNSYLREPTKFFKPSNELSEDEPEVGELNFPLKSYRNPINKLNACGFKN